MMKQTRNETAKSVPPPPKSGLTLCVDENVAEYKTADDLFSLLCFSQLIYIKVVEVTSHLSSYKHPIEFNLEQVTADTIMKYKTSSNKDKRKGRYIIQDIFWKYLVSIFRKIVALCPSSLTLWAITSLMGWLRFQHEFYWDDYIYKDFLKLYRIHFAPTLPEHFNAWTIARLEKWFAKDEPDKCDVVVLPKHTDDDNTFVKGMPRMFTFTE